MPEFCLSPTQHQAMCNFNSISVTTHQSVTEQFSSAEKSRTSLKDVKLCDIK